ncbi:quinone-dependent dihydroorotate dehydrogenase [Qipengyuania sp. JC766]|uniref:quinone-dependent dihydroorotate dehydrogenase n=1 Tax=Qipengyuania sp. JC766 TaxID=3232139 RepID=UPI003459F4FD
MLFDVLRPAIFSLDPERAHRLTIRALKLAPLPGTPSYPDGLGIEVAGLSFPTPLGLAPGFDKDAEVPRQMMALGFGHVEVGTLTPLPQTGNPKPRLFRLVEDRAVINRMGFNNRGQASARERLERRTAPRRGILGINIGANKDSEDRATDYRLGTQAMAPYADYLTVNISSPNTPGLRALQDASALEDLLDGVIEARGRSGPPIFLKVAPDLEPRDIDDIARIGIEKKLGALIVSNTTISRPALASRHRAEAGGLSGAPLHDLALQRLRDFRQATGGTLPLIGVGGISTASEAWQRIRAGASLVQLYSALVYEGPGLAKRINRDLAALMERDGFNSIAEAVGSE